MIKPKYLFINLALCGGAAVADADKAPDSSFSTDNPVAALAVVFVLVMVVSIGIINFFGLGRRGRIVLGIVFGLVALGIIAPLMISSGMVGIAGLLVGLGAAAAYAFVVILFGGRIASWFSRHEAVDRYRR